MRFVMRLIQRITNSEHKLCTTPLELISVGVVYIDQNFLERTLQKHDFAILNLHSIVASNGAASVPIFYPPFKRIMGIVNFFEIV